jgi:aminoglycoside phosphotransferase (APT) family kinase protein
MPPMASHDLPEALRGLLGADHVSDLTRLSGGASRDTFRFRADGRDLVLQRQRPGTAGIEGESVERDMGVEAALIRAAHRAGVTVAEVVAASTDETILGAPFLVLQALEGETIARKILRDEIYADARRNLIPQCAASLARLHAIPTHAVDGLVEVEPVARYRELLDTFGQPHPAFELAFRWLDAHRPDAGSSVIVHGDFRLGNLIVGPEGLRAVIDWELAHLGDPAEDLGWLCVKAWRFGSRHPVAGIGDYDDLLDAYAAAGGAGVDRVTLRWWEVMGTLKWGIMCIMQTHAHLSGLAVSHELAAIGRRVCENEHDLFLAIEGAW